MPKPKTAKPPKPLPVEPGPIEGAEAVLMKCGHLSYTRDGKPGAACYLCEVN